MLMHMLSVFQFIWPQPLTQFLQAVETDDSEMRCNIFLTYLRKHDESSNFPSLFKLKLTRNAEGSRLVTWKLIWHYFLLQEVLIPVELAKSFHQGWWKWECHELVSHVMALCIINECGGKATGSFVPSDWLHSKYQSHTRDYPWGEISRARY